METLQQFAGLENFYRNFVENYSKIATPLYRLTRKNEVFVWNEQCESAFSELKKRITSSPILAAFQPHEPCRLQTDASAIGVGEILSQYDNEGNERVVANYSRRLNETESRYSSAELECYAVVLAVKHFRPYLEGMKFEILTDCKALEWLLSVKDNKNRLFRWSVPLSTYDFSLKHRPAITNQAADALSRNPVFLLETYDEYANEISNYDIERNGRTYVKLFTGEKLVIPIALRNEILQKSHDELGHPGTKRTKRIISAEYWFPDMAKYVSEYVRTCHNCQVTKQSNKRKIGKLQPIETREMMNDTWSMDTIVFIQWQKRHPQNTCKSSLITIADIVGARRLKRIRQKQQ